MRFTLVPQAVDFDIPDEWWLDAAMPDFKRRSRAYRAETDAEWPMLLVEFREIDPPRRAAGVRWFDRQRLVSVLSGFVKDDVIPPVEVHELPRGPFRYGVRNGFHRFYASVAAGFECLPVSIRPYFGISA